MNAIVYLTFNSKNDIARNFNALINGVTKESKLVVIDNNSCDGSAGLLEKGGWNVHRNHVNTGYTKGINKGLDLAIEFDPEWVFIINPDVMLSEGWDKITDDLPSCENCGIITCRLVNSYGNVVHSGGVLSKKRKPILFPCFYDVKDFSVLGYDLISWSRFVHRDIDCFREEKVAWGTFAFVALKAEMVKELGKLDEQFFLYCSDLEYCLRARLAGWSILYRPMTFVHSVSSSVRNADDAIKAKIVEDYQKFARLEEEKWETLPAVGSL